MTQGLRRWGVHGFMRPLALLVLAACGASTPAPVSAPQVSEEAPPTEAADPGYASEPLLRTPSPFPEVPPQPAWRPDRELPDRLVDIVRRLFDTLEAPDPRGLELRRVTIRSGNVWGGDGGAVETVGWLLPGEAVDGRRFVIAPNALIYAAEALGPVADPAFLERDAEERQRNPGNEEASLIGGWVWWALLARVGESEAATEGWQRFNASRDQWNRERGTPTPTDVADQWLWTRVERGVCAHMRADDPLALRDATVAANLLGAHGEHFGDEAARWSDIVLPLLDDQRRRQEDGDARRPRDPDAPRPDRAPALRVEELVRELDQVAARQMGQPGGVMLTMDPVVTELIELGEVSVEPMLRVLEEDVRLTRSVHFWRDFARSRTILGVQEAAYVVLANVLGTDFFRTASTGDNLTLHGLEGRRRVAARIRAHWDRFRGMAEHERWYTQLRDDDASADQWMEAANGIVTPSNVDVRRGSMFGTHRIHLPRDENGTLRGEGLRDGRRPTVTDLLSSRMGTLMARSDGAEPACTMASALIRWDLQRGRRPLKEQLRRCFEGECSCTAPLANALANERGVLSRYARWLRDQTPDGYGLSRLLAPFAENERHPALRNVLPRLLEHGPWLDAIASMGPFDRDQLLRVEAVRQALVRELGRTDPIGTLQVGEGGSYSYQLASGGGGGGSYGNPAGAVAAGTTTALRQADSIASRVSEAPGAPDYRLIWPEAQRDEAIAALRGWLLGGARPPQSE